MSERRSRDEDPRAARLSPGETRSTAEAEGVIPCEVCGGDMHYIPPCEIRCFRCGYTRDCSDP